MIQPGIDPKLACFRLAARCKVVEHTGERISRREIKRRGEGPLTYLFEIDSYWCMDGAVGGIGLPACRGTINLTK